MSWLRDDQPGAIIHLQDPGILAAEIVEDLEAALDQFAQIAAEIGVNGSRVVTRRPVSNASGPASAREFGRDQKRKRFHQ